MTPVESSEEDEDLPLGELVPVRNEQDHRRWIRVLLELEESETAEWN